MVSAFYFHNHLQSFLIDSSTDQKFYVELTMKADPDRGVPGPHPKKTPLVRCDSESIAQKASIMTASIVACL